MAARRGVAGSCGIDGGGDVGSRMRKRASEGEEDGEMGMARVRGRAREALSAPGRRRMADSEAIRARALARVDTCLRRTTTCGAGWAGYCALAAQVHSRPLPLSFFFFFLLSLFLFWKMFGYNLAFVKYESGPFKY